MPENKTLTEKWSTWDLENGFLHDIAEVINVGDAGPAAADSHRRRRATGADFSLGSPPE